MEEAVFKIFPYTRVPKGTRIFNSGFFNEIKFLRADRAFEKSRLVVQAYYYKDKVTVLTQSPTIQRVSQQIILSIAVSLQPSCHDVSLYVRNS